MEIPVINFSKLNGEKRSEIMALLHPACQQWGCFMIENHEIDKELMDNVKTQMKQHYEENMKRSFYESDVTKKLGNNEIITNSDWESSFFIWHRPNSNISELTSLSTNLRELVDEYIDQLMKVAENLSELMSENLGLQKSHMKETFSGGKGPSVGTKVAIYPECPKPDLIRGLREHTDAGGIILLLQDEQIPGLEFFKGGEWVAIPPSKNNRIFVNTGDQVEVLSNGLYKSVMHRVKACDKGSRLSIASFYNPSRDALISPAPKLLYPANFSFQDYLELYAKTKFADKGARFESMKQA